MLLIGHVPVVVCYQSWVIMRSRVNSPKPRNLTMDAVLVHAKSQPEWEALTLLPEEEGSKVGLWR